MRLNLAGGAPALETAIERFVRQIFTFPLRLWRVASADLPAASGENEGGIYWNASAARLGYSDGAAHHTLQPSDDPVFTGTVHAEAFKGTTTTTAFGSSGQTFFTLDETLAMPKVAMANAGILGTPGYTLSWRGDIHTISSDPFTSVAVDHEGLYDTVNSGGRIILSQSGAVPSAANQVVGHIDFMGKYAMGGPGSGDNPTPGHIRGVAGGAWTSSSTPFEFVFLTCPSDSLTATERFRVTGSGVTVSGSAAFSGQASVPAGTVAAPGLAVGDPDTGFYRGGGFLKLAYDGADAAWFGPVGGYMWAAGTSQCDYGLVSGTGAYAPQVMFYGNAGGANMGAIGGAGSAGAGLLYTTFGTAHGFRIGSTVRFSVTATGAAVTGSLSATTAAFSGQTVTIGHATPQFVGAVTPWGANGALSFGVDASASGAGDCAMLSVPAAKSVLTRIGSANVTEVNSAGFTVNGGLRTAGTMIARFENGSAARPTGSAGAGLELMVASGQTHIQGYNPTTAALVPVNLAGSSIHFPALATTASAANAFLDSASNNRLLRSTSSARYKTAVRDLTAREARKALRLRPVVYRSTAARDDGRRTHFGLIAEEVARLEPRLVEFGFQEDQFEEPADASGVAARRIRAGETMRPDGVRYDRLAVMLLAVVRNQEQRIAALERAAGGACENR